MKVIHQDKIMFDASYSPNTELARKERTKSVFVAPSSSDIRVFSYHSMYEIEDQATLIKCKNSTLSHQDALEEATMNLTGLSLKEYSQKIDELYLEKKESYKEMKMIWENYNFPTPDLDFSDLPNYASLDISTFQPKHMLEEGLEYVRDKSLYNLRNKDYKDIFFIFEDLPLFFSHLDEMQSDELLFLKYMNFLHKKQENADEENIHKLSEKSLNESFLKAANAIGVLDTKREEFIKLAKSLFLSEDTNEDSFTQKIVYTFWNFQKKLKEHLLQTRESSVLYYGRYAKDFINLYENNFFQHPQKHDKDLKFGVSIWAELNAQSLKKSNDSGITNSTLKVSFAKSYVDGSYESVATLLFDYTICAYKKEDTQEQFFSNDEEILAATSEKIYSLVSQQFYPLFGITKEEGIAELSKQFQIDDGERGGILNLRDINISAKYSDRIIPELIKGVYDLVNFDSYSSFPLFACMVGGDIIVNDELFPLIKSPLLTVISAEYLTNRIEKIQKDKATQNSNYSDFFSEYNSNAYHYYNRMTFDPLRPIFVY